ncbi:DUF7344 domain-containing protein [Halorussus sp. AFM4]|uniref:DUF7344 domain-containing protein n=1 Tax=Halorussus sp. AFM4 TaxID=3421651 RepID=UPI003EBA0C85
MRSPKARAVKGIPRWASHHLCYCIYTTVSSVKRIGTNDRFHAPPSAKLRVEIGMVKNQGQKSHSTHRHIDSAFDVLSSRNRRAIVRYFQTTDEPIATVNDLAHHCKEVGSEGNNAVANDRMTAQLHHRHLPKLADAGVIEYDARSETVRYKGDSLTEELLERASGIQFQ